MKAKSCFILGFPFAGKTTFLAALWYSLQQQGVQTKLSLESFMGDQSYLSLLVKKWLAGEEMIRTSTAIQKDALSVRLKDKHDKIFDLVFPDYSGEVFNNLYIDREIKPDLAKKIKKSDTFLLFINPEKIVEPDSISSIPYQFRNENKEYDNTEYIITENDNEENPNTDTPKLVTRDPIKNDSTAVKLIELLQFIEFLYEKEKVSLSVIVSAWDLVDNRYQLPQECIRKRLPMLWQYLIANADNFDMRYYGISAQGDKLNETTETHIEQLLEKYEDNPAERIQVIDGMGHRCNDITLPLWNLLSNETEAF